MCEFELIKKMSATQDNQEELAKIINETDFKGKNQAIEAAIFCFDITPNNIKANIKAAKKLASLDNNPIGFRASIRMGHLLCYVSP